jgi:hypothetical protein
MPRRTASPLQRRSRAVEPLPGHLLLDVTHSALAARSRGPAALVACRAFWLAHRRPRHPATRYPFDTAVGSDRLASVRAPRMSHTGLVRAGLEERSRRHVTDRVGGGAASVAADIVRCGLSRLALVGLAGWPACHRSSWRRDSRARGRYRSARHVTSGVGPLGASAAVSGMSHLGLAAAQPGLRPVLSGAACHYRRWRSSCCDRDDGYVTLLVGGNGIGRGAPPHPPALEQRQ